MRRLLVLALGCGFDDRPPCAFALSYAPTFTTANQSAVLTVGSDGAQSLQWIGRLDDDAVSGTYLFLQELSGGGASTPDWPTGAVTPKTGLELGSGDVLMLIGSGSEVDANRYPLVFDQTIGGTLDVTSVSPNFTGTARNVMFLHEDDVGGVQSADPDMCTSEIASVSFDAPVP